MDKTKELKIAKAIIWGFIIVGIIVAILMIWVIIDMIEEFGAGGCLILLLIGGFILYLLWNVFFGGIWRSRIP